MTDLRIEVFLLALVRTTCALTSVPALREHGLPVSARVAMAALLSFLVLPAACALFPRAVGADVLIACAAAEVLTGLFVGLVVSAVFEGVAIGMRVVETQAGFSFGASIMGSGGGALGNYYHALAMVLFFSTGAYRMLLRGLAGTFSVLPVGGLPHVGTAFLVQTGSAMFACALHVAIPIVGAILLADAALGLIARTAPQMNVFAIGFPVKVTVALAVALLSLTAFTTAFTSALTRALAGLGF